MKGILTLLVKSTLLLLELTAASSARDAAIQEKMVGSPTTLIFQMKK